MTGDLPAESVSKSDAYGEREVIASFRNLGLPFIAWGLGLTLLPFEILLLWGTWNPGGAWAWSAVALGYALYVGVRGWAPWEMALNQPMRRRHKPDFWLLDPTAYAVGEFLTAARQRIAATLITASAILTPWLIMGLSRLAGGRPVNPKAVLPVSALAFFGFADGIRAGNLAMLLLTRRVERNWGSLSASGTAEVRGGLGGITGGPPASVPIPGSLELKIMPGQIAGHMRGRLLLPAEGFGIGPGKAGTVDGQVEGARATLFSK